MSTLSKSILMKLFRLLLGLNFKLEHTHIDTNKSYYSVKCHPHIFDKSVEILCNYVRYDAILYFVRIRLIVRILFDYDSLVEISIAFTISKYQK